MLRHSAYIAALSAFFAAFSIWPSSAFAQPSEEWGAWMHPGWGWGGMMFGGGMMIVFWGVTILAVVLLAKAIGGSHAGNVGVTPPVTSSAAPLDILKERFAKGEIDASEYEERKKILLD